MPSRIPAQRTAPRAHLDAGHREMLLHIEELSRLVEQLDRSPPTEHCRQQARALIGFFTGPARDHNRDEEQHAFPNLLKSNDAELVREVERLSEDHAWIELHWLDIEPLLMEVVDGQPPASHDMLRDAAGTFAALVRDHMAREETFVFPHLRA